MIVKATVENKSRILELVNLLASFPLPDGLTTEDVVNIDIAEVEEYFSYQHPDGHQHLFIYKTADNTIAGFILGRILSSGIPHIAALAVDQNYQRQGIAKNLISHLENTYKNLGHNRITLNVYATNTVAKGMYDRIGFDDLITKMQKPL